jgi:hypothetical protein
MVTSNTTLPFVGFSNLNPYESLEFVTGESPDDLLRQLKMIRTPIKLVAIVPYGSRHVAYIMGDVRKSEQVKQPKQLRGK